MAKRVVTSLLDRLPKVRGRYREQVPLSGMTWFRVGGPAEVLFRPADRDDLCNFLRQKPADVPLTVIGVGSNVLVRDGGIPGVVMRLGREFADIKVAGEIIKCGAVALDVNVATVAKVAGLGGLEFLSGVPGTIGGALRMNAGAYGKEIRDVVVEAEAVDATGAIHRLQRDDLGLSYRHAEVSENWIFLGAHLRGHRDEPDAIARRIVEIHAARTGSQPIRTRTGGSTFKNPPDAKAWQLIDRAGCRGLRRGGAMVSEQHCNFLINLGAASAADIEALGEEVRTRVRETCGVELEWEIRRLGEPLFKNAAGGRG